MYRINQCLALLWLRSRNTNPAASTWFCMLLCTRTPSVRIRLNGRRASWRSSALCFLASPASARAWATRCASRCCQKGWSRRGKKAKRCCSGRRQQRQVCSTLGLRRVSHAGAPRAAAWRRSWLRWRGVRVSALRRRGRLSCPALRPLQPRRSCNSPAQWRSAAWRRRPTLRATVAACCYSCAVQARRASWPQQAGLLQALWRRLQSGKRNKSTHARSRARPCGPPSGPSRGERGVTAEARVLRPIGLRRVSHSGASRAAAWRRRQPGRPRCNYVAGT